MIKELGTDSLIENVSNLQVFLNHSLMQTKKISESDIDRIFKTQLNNLEGIHDILNAADLGNCSWVNLECQLIKNGYNNKRSGDFILLSEPGWIADYSIKGGTTHGSPYLYDTHVPMLWLGWKIPNGISYQRTETPDIAPTLALLLGITAPNGTTGTPMVTLLDQQP